MRTILLFISLTICALQSRSADTLKYYINHSGKAELNTDLAAYFRVAYKSGSTWFAKDYYAMDLEYYTQGEYIDDSLEKPNGLFQFYYTNKQLKSVGKYSKGVKTGLWKNYNERGILRDSSFYNPDGAPQFIYHWYDDGTPAFRIIYKENKQRVETSWHSNGQIMHYGRYSHYPSKDSTWIYFHQNGNVASIQEYKNGIPGNMQCFNETGKKIKCKVSIESYNHAQDSRPNNDSVPYIETMPEAGYNINHFLATNIRYPKAAKKAGIEGKVYIHFVLDEQGYITDISQLGNKRLGYFLDEEAIRVISILPKWQKPGTQNNVPVKVYFTMPITFKIN